MRATFSAVGFCLASLAFLSCPSSAHATLVLGGDPIGPDNTLTNNRGAITSTQEGALNTGHVGVVLELAQATQLDSIRAIVSAIPETNSPLFDDIRFDVYDWRVSIWTKSNFFAGSGPEFVVPIGQPPGITFAPPLPNGDVFPITVFGNSGPGGNNADTFDYQWDVSSIPQLQLAAGDWVLGLQKRDSGIVEGIANISRSLGSGLPAVWSSDPTAFNFPQGYAFGTPPNDTERWAITLTGTAVPEPSSFLLFSVLSFGLATKRIRECRGCSDKV